MCGVTPTPCVRGVPSGARHRSRKGSLSDASSPLLPLRRHHCHRRQVVLRLISAGIARGCAGVVGRPSIIPCVDIHRWHMIIDSTVPSPILIPLCVCSRLRRGAVEREPAFRPGAAQSETIDDFKSGRHTHAAALVLTREDGYGLEGGAWCLRLARLGALATDVDA